MQAVEEARAQTADAVASFAEAAARLKPGEMLVGFNPHVNTPGVGALPSSASGFAFWRLADEETLSTFMENLGLMLDASDLTREDYNHAPRGYLVARYALRFETHCKFSAWLAVENVGREEMEHVREAYRIIGMPEEAQALERAEQAWYAAGGHDGKGYDAAGAAYRSGPNPNANEDARWFTMLDRLRQDHWWDWAGHGGTRG